MTYWEATLLVLREADNPAVMWGDEGLCHDIAERLGWPHEAWKTSSRVLAALAKTPGGLVKRKTVLGNGRVVNCFWLPEEWAKKKVEG